MPEIIKKWILEMDCLTPRILFRKILATNASFAPKYVYPSRACLSSLRHVLAKYEDEVPDVSGSNQNIETSCKSKLKFTELKDLCFQKYRSFSRRYHFIILLREFTNYVYWLINPLIANLTKWSNTLKQFVGNFPTNCLSVFDNFMRLALEELNCDVSKSQYCVLSHLIKGITNYIYIYVLDLFNLQKACKSLQNQISQFKVKITQGVIRVG